MKTEKCGMCGKDSKLADWGFRWYQYDNGARFRERICATCVELHEQSKITK